MRSNIGVISMVKTKSEFFMDERIDDDLAELTGVRQKITTAAHAGNSTDTMESRAQSQSRDYIAELERRLAGEEVPERGLYFEFKSIANASADDRVKLEADEKIPVSLQPQSIDAAVAATLKGLPVLVAVREPNARAEIAKQLQSYGCEVSHAQYDAQLYDRFSQGLSPDVAILDWTMMHVAEYCTTRNVFVIGIEAPRLDPESVDYLFALPQERNPRAWDDTPQAVVGNFGNGLQNYLTSRVFILDYEPVRKKREEEKRCAQNILERLTEKKG